MKSLAMRWSYFQGTCELIIDVDEADVSLKRGKFRELLRQDFLGRILNEIDGLELSVLILSIALGDSDPHKSASTPLTNSAHY